MPALLLACFFLSGISGLIYEVVWTRKLTLVFGSTTLAVSLTLAAYLGGLALGAYLFGRLADRLRRPALVYGAMEVAIGFYGALSPWLLDAIGPAYVHLRNWLHLPVELVSLLQFGLVAIGLLLPTLLMGGTLPVLVRTDPSGWSGLGARVGRLYAVNTAGAVVGAALTGFVLLPQIGLQGSLLSAAGINAALGVVVLGAFRCRPRIGPPPIEAVETTNLPLRSPVKGSLTRAVTGIVVLVSGFCALSYEVVWTRVLGLVLGSSIQAFSLMLSTFLLGLSGGIALGGWVIRKGWHSPLALSLVQLAVGVSVFSTSLLLQQLPDWFVALYVSLETHQKLFVLSQAGLCAAILFIPTLMIGLVFPLAIELSTRTDGQEAGHVGRLYALNTVGSIAGALLAGLLFIPTVGIHRSLLLGVWLNLGLATLVATQLSGEHRARRFAIAGFPLAVAALLTFHVRSWDPLLMTTGVYMYASKMVRLGVDRYRQAQAQSRLLFYREGPTATVAVKRTGSRTVLSIDGRAEGSTTATAQVLLGHFPFMFGWPIQDVLIIGFGTGATTGAVTLYPVRRVEVIEIEPGVIEASALFEGVNHRPLTDPRVGVRVDDARNVLLVSPPSSYDLIVSQPSFPWASGSSKLFTLEFYRLARSRLHTPGIFAQWVQLYNMDFASVMTQIKTFSLVFPQTLAIEVGGGSGEILLLGLTDQSMISWTALSQIFSSPIRAKELARVGVPNPGTLLERLLLGPQEIPRLVAGYPTNTDDNGRLEFSAAGSLYRSTTETNLDRLRQGAGDPWTYVHKAPEGPTRRTILVQMADAALLGLDFDRGLGFAQEAVRLGGTVDGYRTLGDLLYVQQRKGEAVEAWRQALARDPKDIKTLRRLVRHYNTVSNAARPPAYQQWCSQLPEEHGLCQE